MGGGARVRGDISLVLFFQHATLSQKAHCSFYVRTRIRSSLCTTHHHMTVVLSVTVPFSSN